MKILNVNMTLEPILGGGTVERTFQMSRSLANAGVDCTILTTDAGLTSQQITALKEVKLVALRTIIKRYWIPLLSYKKVRNIVRGADIIHLMNHWTFLNALIYILAKRLNKPYVVCPAGTLPICGRKKLRKKIYNCIIGKKIIRNASNCIAISINEISHFQDYGVDPNKIVHIPNGVNSEDFKAKDSTPFKEKYGLKDFPIILFLGRLSHIKGPDLLLRAYANIKHKIAGCHLVFAGPDDGMLPELKNIIAETGLEKSVHFLGYLSKDEKNIAYHACDLLVIPSRQEAMSIVVLEAAMTETAVLITEKCGFNEVEDFHGGLVVPATVNGLQKGLIDILNDTSALKSMGKNLKKHISNHFTWDAIIDKYIELYREILAET